MPTWIIYLINYYYYLTLSTVGGAHIKTVGSKSKICCCLICGFLYNDLRCMSRSEAKPIVTYNYCLQSDVTYASFAFPATTPVTTTSNDVSCVLWGFFFAYLNNRMILYSIEYSLYTLKSIFCSGSISKRRRNDERTKLLINRHRLLWRHCPYCQSHHE